MRLGFDLVRPVGVTLTIHPYISRCAEPPNWKDARVELTLFVGRDEEDDDEIVIETANVATMREALQNALNILDDLETYYKKDAADKAAHAVACAVCGTYYDTRQVPVDHADGRGMTCFGDGTVLIIERPIELRGGNGTWGKWTVSGLREGDVFRLTDDDDDEGRVYTALGPVREVYHQQGKGYASRGVRVKRPL